MIRTPDSPGVLQGAGIAPRDTPSNTVPFFHPNWRQPVEVQTRWVTVASSSMVSHSQQRLSLISRPLHSCSALHTSLKLRDTYNLKQFVYGMNPEKAPTSIQRYQIYNGYDRTWIYGLFSDIAIIEGVTDLGAGGWQLDVDLSDGYRFYVGGRCFIFTGDDEEEVSSGINVLGVLHDMTVANLTTITVQKIGNWIPRKGMAIVPAIDCDPLQTIEGSAITCEALELEVTAAERAGRNQLLPTSRANISAIYPYYDGYPIFEPDHNWRDSNTWGYGRAGIVQSVGQGSVSSMDGLRNYETSSFSFTGKRADFWPVLQLFDSRFGSAVPFWVVTEIPLWRALEVAAGTTFNIPQDRLLTPFTALAFKPVGGGQTLVRNAQRVGTLITVDTALPAGTYNICLAYLGTFASDALEQTWITPKIVECEFSTIGVGVEEELFA